MYQLQLSSIIAILASYSIPHSPSFCSYFLAKVAFKGIKKSAPLYGCGFVVCRLDSFFYGIYRDLTLVAALAFEFYATFDSSENGVILTHANIVAGMEFGATLPNDDAASGYQLAVMSFGARRCALESRPLWELPVPFLCACNCRIISNITFTSYVLGCEHIADTDVQLIPLHKPWFVKSPVSGQ